MAGPLQPIPGYNPAAGGSDPFLHVIGNALRNVATLGESEHPGSLRQYGNDVASSFDPRHPAGAINLASIFLPGGRLGQAKAEGMNLLVKSAMPTRRQMQLAPGASVGGLFAGSGTTSRDALIADLFVKALRNIR